MARRTDIALMASLSHREIEHGLPWSWTTNRLSRFIDLNSSNAYVAEVDGQFAGFSVASMGETRAHLVLLAVEKKWQNHGVGRELLDWQLHAAQTAGLADMSLEVRAKNKDALRFYAAANFRKVRVLTRYYSGIEDAIRLRLSPIRVDNANVHKHPTRSLSPKPGS